MTEIAPDAKTFDVADMFTGKAYPKEVVTVYMDEATAYELHKLREEALLAVQAGDEKKAAKVEKELKALVKKGEESRYDFHLTGASRDDRKALIDIVRAEYPSEVDFLGREKPNPEADEKYANLVWSLHIEKIERPDGALIVAPDEATVKIIRGQAPDPAILAIEKGIQELSEGVKGGFEVIAQGHDFLS